MRTKHGGETVDRGFYLSFGRREILSLEEMKRLPGEKEDTFYSIPIVAMLFLGPFLGLFYVMFLPFISLAMVAVVLSRAMWAMMLKAERRVIQISNRMRSHSQTAKVPKETGRFEAIQPLPVPKTNDEKENNRKAAA